LASFFRKTPKRGGNQPLTVLFRDGQGDTTRVEFKPFDPATKRAEAAYQEADGVHRYTKGAPAVIAQLFGVPELAWLPQEQELAAFPEFYRVALSGARLVRAESCRRRKVSSCRKSLWQKHSLAPFREKRMHHMHTIPS
jgi:magnesium-transporting ATPase (P-type)